MLMDDHKTKRMGSALEFLMRYAQEGDEFLDSIVTGDETWVFTTLLNPNNSHCNGAICIPQNQNIQNFNFSKKNHGVQFLGQKRHSPGQLHASWRNN